MLKKANSSMDELAFLFFGLVLFCKGFNDSSASLPIAVWVDRF